jgi:hypothetical protein
MTDKPPIPEKTAETTKQNLLAALLYDPASAADTERLLLWLDFLGGNRNDDLLVVIPASCTDTESAKACNAAATKAFRKAEFLIPDLESYNLNHSFLQVLYKAEERNRSVFLINARSLPLRKDWLGIISKAYGEVPNPIMGAYSPEDKPHITQVAVYDHNWRSYIPELAKCDQTENPWQFQYAQQILPLANRTSLIKNVPRGLFRPDWLSDETLAIMTPDTDATAMRWLDKTRHEGKFFAGRQDVISAAPEEFLYFHTENATRPYRQGNLSVGFTAYGTKHGGLAGITKVRDPQVKAMMLAAAASTKTSITQITREQFFQFGQKKRELYRKQEFMNFGKYGAVPRSDRPIQSTNAALDKVGQQAAQAAAAAEEAGESGLPKNVGEVLRIG